LGFSTEAVKAMSPEKLAEEIKQAICQGGDCVLENDAAGLFAIVKTSEGKYPKWKEEFSASLGPAEVGRVEGETAKQYSYAVVDVAGVKPGSGVLLGCAKAVKPAKK
jgi:hypothetical protein